MSHALIIGAGPAGLMAAEVLAKAGHQVTITDAMPSVGRKFLMAGKSGLNLTKAEPLTTFVGAYGDQPTMMTQALRDFGPDAVQSWAQDLGQEVFTGSTGRVFPVAMKASPLLRAWLTRLADTGVSFRTRWRWVGWNDGDAVFETRDGRQTVTADVTVLAMGGASWARLGSDGAWAGHLAGVAPFKPANCGFEVDWTPHMAPFFGKPIKATALQAGVSDSRGEWVISERGVEGGGIYEISAPARDGAPIFVDLMPDVTQAKILARLSKGRAKMSLSQILKKTLRLPAEKAALFMEWGPRNPGSLERVAEAVKRLPVPHSGPLAIDDAISTAGGLRWDSLAHNFMVCDRPGVFAAGEMLDWEAPTGGYLITGCLATGRAAGLGAAAWLRDPTA